MRGDDREPNAMFSYVSAEQRVPKEHPLRAIRALVDDVLRDMSRAFDGLYARVGRPPIPPERLLRAQLLQIFYSIRSERLVDGAVGLQRAVPVVRRHGHGGADLGAHGVFEESRPVVESGDRAQLVVSGNSVDLNSDRF